MKPYYENEFGKLYHGDCLDIMPKLKPVSFIYIDPPYNVGKGYGPGADDLKDSVYLNRMYDTFELCLKLSDKMICHIPKKYLEDYLSLLPKGNLIILKRDARGALARPFLWSDQFDILYAYGDPISAPCNVWQGIRLKGEGWFFREDTFGHRGYTPQPIAIKSIECMTRKYETVLDCFAGTGTTLLACQRFERNWFGIEYEEENCEIAAGRLENERKQLKLFRN